MVDPEGVLNSLDWENAMIAPPEHDLFAFVDDEGFGGHFHPAYIRQVGSIDLDINFSNSIDTGAD